MDLKEAFDKVPRTILFSTLFEAGITGKVLIVVQDFYLQIVQTSLLMVIYCVIIKLT